MRNNLLHVSMVGLAMFALAGTSNAQTVQGRQVVATQATSPAKLLAGQLAPKSKVTKVAKASAATVTAEDNADPSKYGELVTVMKEDFSKMTTGEVGAPDTEAQINSNDLSPYNYWINILPEYTTVFGWGSDNCAPAGGCIALDPNLQTWGEYEQAYARLNTPRLDCSGGDGMVYVRFKARTDAEGTQLFGIESANTHGWSPTWDYNESYYINDIDKDWKEYVLEFHGGDTTYLFNMYTAQTELGQKMGSIYLDDFEVLTVNPYVHMPEVLAHRQYNGDNFLARWTSVDGADGYLLDVYSLVDPDQAESASNIAYLLKDQEASTNSYRVENAESGKTYYYKVRAKKGDYVSTQTVKQEVCDLVAPELQATKPVDHKFTASWDSVPSAERYNYWAYYERTADKTGTFTLTDLDFNGLTMPDGSEITWTLDEPTYNSFDSYVVSPLNQGGWIAKNGIPYKDFVSVDGFHYIYNHTDAGLISPELDLSKNGGKVNVNVKLAAEKGTVYYDDGTQEDRLTRCAVALFNFDEEKEDYTQSELIYLDNLKESWDTYNVELTSGTERSVLGLYAVYSPTSLYIDDLKITQEYNEGETFLDPFFFSHWYDGKSIEVTMPWDVEQSACNIYHRATAVKYNSNNSKHVESKYSDFENVGKTTGIAKVSLANAPVQLQDGNIVVKSDAAVNIYRLDGSLVFSGKGNVAYPAQRGVYIVKVGDQSVKVRF